VRRIMVCGLLGSAVASFANPDPIVTFDGQIAQGTVTVRKQSTLGQASPGGAQTATTIERSTWGGGRSLERVTVPTLSGSGATAARINLVVQEQGYVARVFEDRAVTSVERGRSHQADYDWFTGFTEGPSLPLGRGLSLLNDCRQLGSKVEGLASDGTRIVATLERLDPPLPGRIERRVSPDIAVVWTYSGWRQFDGVWMPARTTSRVVGGSVRSESESEVLNFRRSPGEWPASTATWFRPAFTVVNQNAGPPIGRSAEEWQALNQGAAPESLEQFMLLSIGAATQRDA